MGIYDREYYRREGPSYLDSLIKTGQVCKWLIIANIAAFILQLTIRDFTNWFKLDVAAVQGGEVWRLLTYGFLHAPNTWMHIVFNMLFLWWFGKMVEDLYGPREFLAFYLTAVVVGGLAFLAQGLLRPNPATCIGASGAVTAVLVLCAIHFPNLKILLFFIIPIPIWGFVIFQVAQDAFLFLSNRPTGVAVTVHLGGAGFAAAYYLGQWRLLGFWERLRSWKGRRSRPQLRVFRGDEKEGPDLSSTSDVTPLHEEIDEQLEAKVDAVLEKVARFGQGSLSENERQILLRASEIYRRRRH